MDGAIAMPTSRLQLSSADARQLTNLIANMIEDHLHSTAASQRVLNTSHPFMKDSSDQRESEINPFCARRHLSIFVNRAWDRYGTTVKAPSGNMR